MTSDQLFGTLGPGEYLRLAHEDGKVHRAFVDDKTGELRICRPSMLHRSREWVKADADDYSAQPCEICK